MTKWQNCGFRNRKPKQLLRFVFEQRPIIVVLLFGCWAMRARAFSLGLEPAATAYSRAFGNMQSMRCSLARSHPLAVLILFPHRRLQVDAKQLLEQKRCHHHQSNVRNFGTFDQHEDKSTTEDPTTTMLSLEIPTLQDTEEIGALFAAVLLGSGFDNEPRDEEGDTGERQIPEGTTIFLDG
jgi:hypothetical protein